MSGQTVAGPNDNYFLSSRGVDSISFNKQASPPIAYLNKGLIYEMNDGILYFNGAPISGSSSTASALETTAADVVVSASAAPTVGQALIATSATNAEWQTIPAQSSGEFVDSDTYFIANGDPTNTLDFNCGGSTGSSTTIVSTSTGTRAIILPDATTFLVGCADTGAAAMEVPKFDSSAAISGSGAYIDVGVDSFYLNSIAVPPPTMNQATVIGQSNFNGGLAVALNGATIIGTRNCANIANVNGSVIVGDANMYQGALSQDIANIVVVGNGYGANGGVVTGANANTMIGNNCGFFVTTATNNSCLGNSCFTQLTSGADNLALGRESGANLTTGSGNIYMRHAGVAAESDTTRIGFTQTKAFMAGIRGVTTTAVDAIPVLISSTGQLGTVSSSIKYKENVEDLEGSKIIYDMRPVQFNYIGQKEKSLGLIAEEIEKIYPEMCIYQDGELLTVDYSRLSTLLLSQVKNLNERINSLENIFTKFLSK